MLNALVDRAHRQPKPVVIFDLDGTLMDNRPRVVAILHELAEHWKRDRPSASERIAQANVDNLAYSLRENMMLLGVEEPNLVEEGEAFWTKRFFTDDYLRHDVALPGAADFARRLHDAGANLVYLTGRDLPNMALGTFASLRDLGFPIGVVGTELVTKPDFETPDATFKAGVAREMRRLGEVMAVFDNEPANCNALFEAYPQSASIFVDTLHAPDPPDLLPEVHVIDGFEL
jgi:beta-phosphoglucomutase-like phosphatase (HAD superfamily)